jgi:hypothetical protein
MFPDLFGGTSRPVGLVYLWERGRLGSTFVLSAAAYHGTTSCAHRLSVSPFRGASGPTCDLTGPDWATFLDLVTDAMIRSIRRTLSWQV